MNVDVFHREPETCMWWTKHNITHNNDNNTKKKKKPSCIGKRRYIYAYIWGDLNDCNSRQFSSFSEAYYCLQN